DGAGIEHHLEHLVSGRRCGGLWRHGHRRVLRLLEGLWQERRGRSNPGPVLSAGLLVALAAPVCADPPGPSPEVSPAEEAAPIEIPPLPPPDPELFAPLAPLEDLADTDVRALVGERAPDVALRTRLEVTGLRATGTEAEYRAQSTLWRGQAEPLTALELANRLRTDERLLLDLLASEGWFAPAVTASIAEREGRRDVTIRVEPGPRYVWREIAIDAVPEGRPDLVADFDLMPGAPLRLSEVEEAEARYKLRLADAGFPFADLGPRDIVIDDEARSGDYLLTGILGRPAVFGAIRLTGHRPFDEAHAAVIARFREGEPWSGALLEDFRRALVATRLLSGTVVTPVDSGRVDAEGRTIADLEVSGEPAPRRSLSGQIGYSTDEGVRAEARWQNRNFWKPEGSLTLRGVLGTQEQRLAADVRKANFGRRDRFLLLGTEVVNEDRPAFAATAFRIGGSIGRESTPIWQKRWVWEGGVEFLYSREREKGTPLADDSRDSYTILAFPGGGGYDGSDDLLDPTRGFRASLRLSPEASFQAGNFEAYARLQGDASAYLRAAEALVLAGRVRLGSIVGTARQNIAPTRRLYAGGGGSVRGYAFQGIGPQTPDSNGDLRPIGGRGLFETSLEARLRRGDWGLVAFVDAGQLEEGPRPRLDSLRFGTGLGVRYYTSFGPLRLDLARAIDRRPED
ncbi:MAG: autotransporter assembly complex protein TamA, partial [Thermaurantiacus tibetensis]